MTTAGRFDDHVNVMGEFGNAMDLYFGGDMNASIALSGQVAGRIDEIKPVAQILEETRTGFFETIDRLANRTVRASSAGTRGRRDRQDRTVASSPVPRAEIYPPPGRQFAFSSIPVHPVGVTMHNSLSRADDWATLACVAAVAFLISITVFAGCTARPTQLPEPPSAPAADDEAGLHVFLTWDAPVDLDLYLTDPSSESLYFGNNPTGSGSRLLTDVRCDTLTATSPAVEHAVMPKPTAGRYRVGVDFLDDCGSGIELVSFRISVDRDELHLEKSGRARAGEFLVIGLDFELGR